MKKHNYLLLFVSLLCLAVSCSKDTLSDAPETPTTEVQTTSDDPNILSMDAVRALALSLPQEFSEGPATRAAGKAIKEIVPFTRFVKSTPLTRALVSEEAEDDVLDNIYVVNYEADAGFAIISADKRLQQVQGYSDYGNITDTMSNPGMRLFMEMLPQYAANTLGGGFGDIYDSFPSWGGGGGDFPPLPPLDTTDLPYLGEFDVERDTVVVQDWQGTYVAPMIPVFWNQDPPFNDQAPWCEELGHNHRSPAGCVAVAIMQILAYYKQPIGVDGQGVPWDDLVGRPYYYMFNSYHQGTAAAVEVARLFRYVGDLAGMKWGCTSSGASIHGAENAFNRIDATLVPGDGFHHDGVMTFTAARAREDLMRSHPIYIAGHPEGKDGHAWIVDGYRSQTRKLEVRTRYYIPATHELYTTETKPLTETREHVHYNWGWGRNNDGWFNPMVFDHKKYEELDVPGSMLPPEGNYDKDIKMIKNLHHVHTPLPN